MPEPEVLERTEPTGRVEVARISLARKVIASVGAFCLVALIGWAWAASRLPASWSVMEMGTIALGGGHASGHGGGAAAGRVGGTSVADLTADPARPADVTLTLVARQQRITVPGGVEVDGYTLNGASPGPTIRARQGQLVQVRLVNESVADGTTLHWHGLDVPASQDGVAGVTQDAVPPGSEHTYRFVAEQAGTYWYHSHQVSHEQVRRGLYGAIVIEPTSAGGVARGGGVAGGGVEVSHDVVALVHQLGGQPTLNGRVADVHVAANPREAVRIRVVNTDDALMAVWAGGPFTLAAVDGTVLAGATEVTGQRVDVTAGARADLVMRAPADGSSVRVHLGGSRSIVVGAPAAAPPVRQPAQVLDLLTYGSPTPLGFDPRDADRQFDYVIGRRPGLVDGRPGLYWTVNGRLYPDVPMFHVSEGDVVRFRIANESSESHPMHLHGHHVLVLSRDRVPSTGARWWVDSLEVAPGEEFEVVLVADNPGIWMDHCHNLPHATEGLVAHLSYDGVTSPYLLGGTAANRPE
ncbi:MAG TPA: multicopper oxidase family protein [Humibacillus sp.]|nr:multicopper oxidase family protein [Humibacillus sp.]